MNSGHSTRSRVIPWLLGIIALLAMLSLVEGGIILALRAGDAGHGLAARILPRRWLTAPDAGRPRLAPDDRIVLLHSAGDIEAIHEQINRLFAAAGAPPGIAARLADPGSAAWPAGSPEDRLASLQEEINRIFQGAFADPDPFSLPSRLEQGWRMSEVSSSIQIADQGSYVDVRLGLPAADASAIALTLRGRLLTVAVEQGAGAAQTGELDPGSARRERRLETKLMLPGPLDAAAARASFRDGLLHVEVPKSAGAHDPDEEPLVTRIPLI